MTLRARKAADEPPVFGAGARDFHMMLKPTGADCNLACAYCFYLHKETLLGQPKRPRMSDAVLEAHIRQYIASRSGSSVVFSWQGGEPTLAGLDFFRRVVELQRKHRLPHQTIENDLQTNGVLLDEAWAGFLKQHRFLVGLSIDGPPPLHDAHRVNKGGHPTSRRVVEAARLLRRFGVPFNALCVVNRQNAQRPLDVYRFLKREIQPDRIQFLPCVQRASFEVTAPALDSRSQSEDVPVTDWSVDPHDWGSFLCRIWDEWLARDYGRVFVDIFEEAVSQALGLGGQRCVSQPRCGSGLALEHNGDVFSCDHYVYEDYRLGNILETNQAVLAASVGQKRFGADKSATLPACCRSCEHLSRCWGECPKNRLARAPDGEAGLNYLCPGLKAFFAHSEKTLPAIVARIRGSGLAPAGRIDGARA